MASARPIATRLRRLATAATALVLAAGATVALLRIPLTEYLVQRLLLARAVAAHIDLERLDLYGCRGTLALGPPGGRIEADFHLHYAPGKLLRGELPHLVLPRLEADFTTAGGHHRLGPFALGRGGGETTAVPPLPPSVRIENALLRLHVPERRPATLRLTASLEATGPATIRVDGLRLTLTQDHAAFAVQAHGTVDLARPGRLRLHVIDGTAQAGDTEVTFDGTLQASGPDGATPAAGESLIRFGVGPRPHVLGFSALRLDATGLGLWAQAQAKEIGLQATLQATLSEPTGTVPRLSLTTDLRHTGAGGDAHLTVHVEEELERLHAFARRDDGAALQFEAQGTGQVPAGAWQVTLPARVVALPGAVFELQPIRAAEARLVPQARTALDVRDIELVLPPEERSLFRLDVSRGLLAAAPRLETSVHGPGGSTVVRATSTGEVSLDLAAHALEVNRWTTRVHTADVAGASVRAAEFTGRAAGDAEQGEATVHLTATGDWRGDGTSARGVRADWPLRIAWEAGHLEVIPEGCLQSVWHTLHWHDWSVGPGHSCLGTPGARLLRADRDGPYLEGRLALTSPVLELRDPAGAVAAHLSGVRLDARGHPGALEAGGTLAEAVLPAPALAVHDTTWQVHPCPGETAWCARVQAAAIDHLAPSPWFQDLGATLDAVATPEHWNLRAALALPDESARLELEGTHQPATGTGSATLRMPPVRLERLKDGLDGLSPATARLVSRVKGTVVAAGQLHWQRGGAVDGRLNAVLQRLSLAPGAANVVHGSQIALEAKPTVRNGRLEVPGSLLLQDLDAELAGLRLERLNGVLHFDDLTRGRLSPRQVLSVASADPGLPLHNGTAEFSLEEDGTLSLHTLDFELAGGRVGGRDIRLDPTAPNSETTLRIEAVDLDRLLAMVAVDGLSGEGRIAGELTLASADGVPFLKHATLASTAPGRFAYRPRAAVAMNGTELLLDALSDFRYERLEVGAAGSADGDTALRLGFSGYNPDYYDGYPVELNLNVNGRLGDLIRNESAGYRVPRAVAERMSRFGQ